MRDIATYAQRTGRTSHVEVGTGEGRDVIYLLSVRYDRTQTHDLTLEEAEIFAKDILLRVKISRRQAAKAKKRR